MRRSRTDETNARFDPYSEYEFATAAGRTTRDARHRSALCRLPPTDLPSCAQRDGKDGTAGFISASIRWLRCRKRSRPGRRVRRRWSWPSRPAIPISSSPRSLRRAGRPGQGRRNHRQQRRGHRRGPAAEVAGRAARADRRGARQGGKMSCQCGLFRSARRGGARADRGRASGDEPRVLAVLSERRLRRGLPERPPPSGLPVHLRL